MNEYFKEYLKERIFDYRVEIAKAKAIIEAYEELIQLTESFLKDINEEEVRGDE